MKKLKILALSALFILGTVAFAEPNSWALEFIEEKDGISGNISVFDMGTSKDSIEYKGGEEMIDLYASLTNPTATISGELTADEIKLYKKFMNKTGQFVIKENHYYGIIQDVANDDLTASALTFYVIKYDEEKRTKIDVIYRGIYDYSSDLI